MAPKQSIVFMASVSGSRLTEKRQTLPSRTHSTNSRHEALTGMVNKLLAIALDKAKMNQNKGMITVYYDGACPTCVKDRCRYEKLSGDAGKNVSWFDITGREERLREMGIDPQKALMELHVENENQQILSEMDAYILLMKRVPLLKPLAWLIGLPLIRPMLSKIYHKQVNSRLRHSGRL